MAAGTVRTDREPIDRRFPRLGSYGDLHWLGWRVGSDRVPGPSDLVIQAVVQLRTEDFAAVRDAYSWQPPPATWTEHVQAALRPYLPSSSHWGHNERYASEVRTDRYGGAVYLNLDTGTVFLNLNSH